MPDPAAALADFVTYVQTHLSGDEKGEAADYLDHLFRALGHAGVKEAGATRETRVAKKGGAKGKNYIDLLWPQRVLIEMKSRGKKFERHYDQIFDYWLFRSSSALRILLGSCRMSRTATTRVWPDSTS